MSMYLPNPDLHPTGYEPGEFIDVPTTARESPASLGTESLMAGQPTCGGSVHLSEQARLTIVLRARQYIAGLVEHHHGDRDDVRSIIHDLHEQSTSISDEERW
jgi:hypothetical protein